MMDSARHSDRVKKNNVEVFHSMVIISMQSKQIQLHRERKSNRSAMDYAIMPSEAIF